MGGFANYLEQKMLDLAFGGVAFSAPATVHIGLSTTTIADAGTGITEPAGSTVVPLRAIAEAYGSKVTFTSVPGGGYILLKNGGIIE